MKITIFLKLLNFSGWQKNSPWWERSYLSPTIWSCSNLFNSHVPFGRSRISCILGNWCLIFCDWTTCHFLQFWCFGHYGWPTRTNWVHCGRSVIWRKILKNSVANSQCGNYRIFLSLRFYVKSISKLKICHFSTFRASELWLFMSFCTFLEQLNG